MTNKGYLLSTVTMLFLSAAVPQAIAQITNLQLMGDIKVQAISSDDLDLGTAAENGTDNQSLQTRLRLTGNFAPHVTFLTEGRSVVNFGEGRAEDPVTGEILSPEDFLELREAWVQLDHAFAQPPLAFRAGRQRFVEPYGFWWNRNFDAARVIYDTTLFKSFLALGENLTSYRTSGDDFNNDDENIFRVLGEASWQWRYQHFVEARAVYQDDHSGIEGIGSFVQNTNRDDSDANLFWTGVRLAGALPGERAKVAGNAYRADLVGLIGTEDAVLSTPGPAGFRVVTGSQDSDVYAWAFDGGVDMVLPVTYEPVLSLGYAFGSGDSNPLDGRNTTFRQTGLDSNFSFPGSSSFGVNHYGSVLRPDLSNLHILTAGLSVPFLRASDVSFIYHYYSLVHESGGLDVRGVSAPLNGTSHDLGQGADIVFATDLSREFDLDIPHTKSLDFRTTLGAFQAGDAFGAEEDEVALRGLFEVRVRF